MKRFLILWLIVCLIYRFMPCQAVSAADTYRVSADTSQMESLNQDTYLIPIILHGNQGIMGFRITFSYDVEKIKILTISRGMVTDAGNFATNLSDQAASGTIDLIWSDTENREMDGSICYLTVKIIAENPEITISYRQADTFNEMYQDVRLLCEKIIFGNSALDSIENRDDQSKTGKSEDKTATEWKQRKNAIEEYNAVQPGLNISEEDIKEAYITYLKKYGVKDAKELSKKKQETLWQDVKQYLIKQKGIAEESIRETDFQDQIEKLVITEKEYHALKKRENMNGSTRFLWWGMIGGIVLVFILSFVVLVIIRRKRDGKDQ